MMSNFYVLSRQNNEKRIIKAKKIVTHKKRPPLLRERPFRIHLSVVSLHCLRDIWKIIIFGTALLEKYKKPWPGVNVSISPNQSSPSNSV